ncbi:MAG: MogA/MoaB family molybdenum cofactor biosynthesis protein [Thermoanaerobaculia bacterium]
MLTVSDTRTLDTDVGGRMAADLVEAEGHLVVERRLVPDEVDAIRSACEALLDDERVECVVVTGGTGLTRRDVTVESLRPLFERELPGFGELFRSLSCAEVGPAAMLSRATAGVVKGRAVFLLPGSPAAVELALTRLILPVVGHLVDQLDRA